MIPTTAASLFIFFALVTPGLSFELLRERRRPAVEETAFREASRIALASVGFNSAAGIVLIVVRLIYPSWIPDPHAWLLAPKPYLVGHYQLIAVAGLLQMILSVAFAVATDWIWRRNASGDIRPGGVWFSLFRTDKPRRTLPWLSAKLVDGTQVAGFLSCYVSSEDPARSELVLMHNVKGAGLQLREPGAEVEQLLTWNYVLLRGDQISYLKVKYLPAVRPSDLHSSRPRGGQPQPEEHPN
jgi:hypothetical protein